MGAGLKPAGAALRSHTAKNPETDASGAKNGILKGLNPCQNPKNPSKCRAERLAVSNCAVVQQPAKPGSKPDAKDDLKSLSLPEVERDQRG